MTRAWKIWWYGAGLPESFSPGESGVPRASGGIQNLAASIVPIATMSLNKIVL
jgi:hypothetical protein